MKVNKNTVIMTHDEIRQMLKIYNEFQQASVAIAEMVEKWSGVIEKLYKQMCKPEEDKE